jgi:hypothetical protein
MKHIAIYDHFQLSLSQYTSMFGRNDLERWAMDEGEKSNSNQLPRPRNHIYSKLCIQVTREVDRRTSRFPSGFELIMYDHY